MTDIGRRAGKARCNLCGDEKSATQMGNHIAQELEYIQNAHHWREATTEPNRFLHVEIQHQRARHFWMHLLVPHETTLGQLDAFLRAAWLECCGHLSRFDFHGLTASSPGSRRPGSWIFDEDDEDDQPLIDWDTAAIRAMPPGKTGTHEYDFGSTTTLLVTSHRSVRLSAGGDVMVIARNAPVSCDVCEKEPARSLTTVAGTITDPDGGHHRGIFYVPVCQSCIPPPQPDDASADCAGEYSICDQADDDMDVAIPAVSSPRMYDIDCFLVDELPELLPTRSCADEDTPNGSNRMARTSSRKRNLRPRPFPMRSRSWNTIVAKTTTTSTLAWTRSSTTSNAGPIS